MKITNPVIDVFQRVEKKYLMTAETYQLFQKEIEAYMQADQYGLHTICNIYFDTISDELIRNSIEKPVYKEKLRLRSYGIPNYNSQVFLEIKRKYKGIVYKRRVAMTLKEASYYLEHGIRPKNDSQILKEIDYFIKFYKPIPKLYLAYDRVAFFGKEDNNIRMTIDANIRSRKDDLALEQGDRGELLLEQDMYLLEIKVPNAYPIWLAEILSKLEIYPISFSKYGNIYKQNLLKEKEELRRKQICSQAS